MRHAVFLLAWPSSSPLPAVVSLDLQITRQREASLLYDFLLANLTKLLLWQDCGLISGVRRSPAVVPKLSGLYFMNSVIFDLNLSSLNPWRRSPLR